MADSIPGADETKTFYSVGLTSADGTRGCGPGYFEAADGADARAKFLASEGLSEAWFAARGLTVWTIEQVS